MRLEQKEVNAIIQALNLYIHEKSELRLYGSRVRDDLKGGDIDLLLLIEDQQLAQKLLSEKHYVLSEIKKNIGDQKIDLLIASKKSAIDDNFIKMILPESIVLKSW